MDKYTRKILAAAHTERLEPALNARARPAANPHSFICRKKLLGRSVTGDDLSALACSPSPYWGKQAEKSTWKH